MRKYSTRLRQKVAEYARKSDFEMNVHFLPVGVMDFLGDYSPIEILEKLCNDMLLLHALIITAHVDGEVSSNEYEMIQELSRQFA